jgi:PilZ domain
MPRQDAPLPEGLAKDYPNKNRRACVRYRCTRPVPRRMAIVESYHSLDGWLLDISLLGLGLLLNGSLEAGTLLFVELESSPGTAPVELLARVVHATATPEKEWLVGCEFVNPLKQEELQALLL